MRTELIAEDLVEKAFELFSIIHIPSYYDMSIVPHRGVLPPISRGQRKQSPEFADLTWNQHYSDDNQKTNDNPGFCVRGYEISVSNCTDRDLWKSVIHYIKILRFFYRMTRYDLTIIKYIHSKKGRDIHLTNDGFPSTSYRSYTDSHLYNRQSQDSIAKFDSV